MEQPNFTLQELAVWVTIVSTAVGTIVLSWKSIKEWFQAKWARSHTDETIDVEKAKVRVTEKEAETHEIQVLFDGYTSLLNAATQSADDAKAEVREMREQMKDMKAEFRDAHQETRSRLDKVERINGEMQRHIDVLEQGYPNPPGPPARPHWH